LISQGVPQLGALNNGEMAKTSHYILYTRLSRGYLALARLSCLRTKLLSNIPTRSILYKMSV